MLLALFSFLAGVLTVASPCVLPVLPILLSGTVGGRARPYGIIFGFALSFTFFTLFLSAIVRGLGVPADVLRGFSILLLIGFGLVLAVPALHDWFETRASRLVPQGRPRGSERPGLWGGVLIGATLGLLWTPCVGPILASVISLALSGQVTAQAAGITLAFSLGTALPMWLIMLGGRGLLNRIPWLLHHLGRVQQAFGALLVVFAVGMAFGADRRVQAWVLDTFPNYAASLSSIEDRASVRNALKGVQAGP